jgi:hypothetical protein
MHANSHIRRSARCSAAIFCFLSMVAAPIAAQQRGSGRTGIQCGGFGRAAVTVVLDAKAVASGEVAIKTGEDPGSLGDNATAVEVRIGDERMRCATSIGPTRVDVTTGGALSLWINAAHPLPVLVRTRDGKALARLVYRPGAADTVLTWAR